MAYPNPTILIVTLNVIDYILQLKGIDNPNRWKKRKRRKEEREREGAPSIYCLHGTHFKKMDEGQIVGIKSEVAILTSNETFKKKSNTKDREVLWSYSDKFIKKT